MRLLSVVIITKNQAWNVERLAASALRATAAIPHTEVLVVDSASSDSTVEVAARLPLNVIVLSEKQRLTPAAGRYAGFHYSDGRHILFLDGDMELCDGWLPRALDILSSDSRIAAITGHILDTHVGAEPPRCVPHRGSDLKNVRFCGGAAMYRRSAMEDVGPFNPYLYSEEEPELCLRLRYKGYRIVELDRPMVLHFGDPRETLHGVLSRRDRNFYKGFGQNIRYHLKTRLLFSYVRERGFALVPLFCMLGAACLFVWSIQWFALLTIASCVFLVGECIRRRSLYLVLISLLRRVCVVEGTIRGFFVRPKRHEEYALSADVMRCRDSVAGAR